jgi:hypothetical protein
MLYALLETENDPNEPTRLPAPAMPLLTRHDEYSMAHLIERHIEFYGRDAKGDERTVALNSFFVRHYMKYRESRLPVVTAIVTSPLVLPDGTLLASQGLDQQRGIIFRIQPELIALLPIPKDCTLSAVSTAMHFLTDVWLCDVATDYAGKCIIIAAALTILERVLLPERPAFFVTAGQRGGGETTTLQMLFLAATGYRAAAAAWSTSEEERRKALCSTAIVSLERPASARFPPLPSCFLPATTSPLAAISRRVICRSASPWIAPTRKIASTLIQIRLRGPLITAATFSARCTPYCSVTRGCVRRTRRPPRPGLRSGGIWSAPASSTPRNSPQKRWDAWLRTRTRLVRRPREGLNKGLAQG